MAEPISCPCCLHEETMRARLRHTEAAHDDLAVMRFYRPSCAPKGQQCTQWDQGWWQCQACDLRLPPHKAGVMLDAALMLAFPDCDSIGSNGIHADTARAFQGDRAEQKEVE